MKNITGKTDVLLFRFFLKLKSFISRLIVIYKFRIQFGTNQKRKDLAKQTELNKEETEAIKRLWSGIKIRKYWFKFYKYAMNNGGLDNYNPMDISRFIPDDLYFIYFCSYFSNVDACNAFDDKNMYDLYFPNVLMPETLFRKINGQLLDKNYLPLTEEDVIEKLIDQKSAILKVAVASSGGKGVLFINDTTDKTQLTNIVNSYNDFVVQKIINQHKLLSEIHPSSINTLRIVTFYYKGTVHVLYGILRMGIGNKSVDNISSGGIFCGITESGCLKKYAMTRWVKCYDKHPTTGFVFEGTKIPGYDACKELCVKQHYRFLRISQLMSWDLAIGEDGSPILIECNLTFNGNHQTANGPLFGEFTENVIKDVFGDKQNRRLNKIFY